MMSRNPILVIRMSSNEDTVTVDGQVYDRSKMNKDQKYLMRRVIVEGLFPHRVRQTLSPQPHL